MDIEPLQNLLQEKRGRHDTRFNNHSRRLISRLLIFILGVVMIDWNIVLYIGLVLIVFGFGLFLYSEIRIREIDRQIAINDKKIKELSNE